MRGPIRLRTHVSLLAVAVVAAAGTGLTVGSPTHVSATPLCYDVSASTFLTGTVATGPECIPYLGPVDCQPTGLTVGTTLGIDADACVPSPINGVNRTGA
ncbi:MAG: hypothetical protein QOD07_3042 [Frankiaceae bacterium]|jgi:hypothetical protein|nr:hypothetical protein [Frankiaceae bacterium]